MTPPNVATIEFAITPDNAFPAARETFYSRPENFAPEMKKMSSSDRLSGFLISPLQPESTEMPQQRRIIPSMVDLSRLILSAETFDFWSFGLSEEFHRGFNQYRVLPLADFRSILRRMETLPMFQVEGQSHPKGAHGAEGPSSHGCVDERSDVLAARSVCRTLGIRKASLQSATSYDRPTCDALRSASCTRSTRTASPLCVSYNAL